MSDDRETEPPLQMVRPFLSSPRPLPRDEVGEDLPTGADGVRAYAITGGRAHASIVLEFETMLQATPDGREAATSLKFERAQILALCQSEVLSVAELSARIHVPIGVVRVVAADLLSEGFLESFHPSANVADDVLLISRLIAGVRSL
jgi:hypothetical protein